MVTCGRLRRVREAFVHEAVLELEPAADPRAPGGAVTVALCGGWDHDPPCPVAPHHTEVAPVATGRPATVRVRVLFAVDPAGAPVVRALVEAALRSGSRAGPDGVLSGWRCVSSGPADVLPHEAAHAARLLTS
jgi:hypothetical protein